MSPGEQAPPIAVTSQDMVIQAGETVTLSGIESVARGNAKITDYDWKLHSGDDNFDTEVTPAASQGAGLKLR